MASRAIARDEATPGVRLTEQRFCSWVGRADPGARIEYHRGHLSVDRGRESSGLDERQRRELGRIADRALALAGEGRLILVQRRVADGRFSYCAVKAVGRRQPVCRVPRGRLQLVEVG